MGHGLEQRPRVLLQPVSLLEDGKYSVNSVISFRIRTVYIAIGQAFGFLKLIDLNYTVPIRCINMLSMHLFPSIIQIRQ